MPKYLTIVKGSENHAPPPPALVEAIDRLIKDAGKRLVGVGGLLPSGKGARAETKAWTRRFLDLHVEHYPGWDCEVEIREMMEAESA